MLCFTGVFFAGVDGMESLPLTRLGRGPLSPLSVVAPRVERRLELTILLLFMTKRRRECFVMDR